jgi:hypothetical protein
LPRRSAATNDVVEHRVAPYCEEQLGTDPSGIVPKALPFAGYLQVSNEILTLVPEQNVSCLMLIGNAAGKVRDCTDPSVPSPNPDDTSACFLAALHAFKTLAQVHTVGRLKDTRSSRSLLSAAFPWTTNARKEFRVLYPEFVADGHCLVLMLVLMRYLSLPLPSPLHLLPLLLLLQLPVLASATIAL